MTHGQSDADLIRTTHNTARYFVENRQLAWVLLVLTCAWGWYSYTQMPKRKDPLVTNRFAAAVCPWPGASAEQIEQLVTRKLEERVAQNARVERIESTTRGNVAIVVIRLNEDTKDSAKEFEDIGQRLGTIRDLPSGAGPIEFLKDFGDTAALLLTVASPKVTGVELSLRARSVRDAIERARPSTSTSPRVSLVVCFPQSTTSSTPARQRDLIMTTVQSAPIGRDLRRLDGPGFVGFDLETDLDDQTLIARVGAAIAGRLIPSQLHPDVWPIVAVRNPQETEQRLAAVAGDKYSYRDLDAYTNLIKRRLQTVRQVAKVSIAGTLPEQITLEYSEERLASLGLQPSRLIDVLAARNITVPGGLVEAGGRSLLIDPSGDFSSEREIGDVIVGTSASGRPMYLRDSVEILRGYQTPARYLNYYLARDQSGAWRRSRAVTVSLQMREGEQIGELGAAVDLELSRLGPELPSDLILARPSDQPLQVRENVDLFMRSLYEAIVLVVLVALVGFWEWRSALLMALAIPITLAMTFGFMDLLRIDIQQVSIASLIIALGLLVDDPVVAGDAIKRGLDEGQPRLIASWLGPTKLATAIMFATITNIVAYLPFLMVSGATGAFIYALPVVLACSLVASRLASMTFIPLLGYYLLRPKKGKDVSIEERRTRGMTGVYYRTAGVLIEHRWLTLAAAVVLLAIGGAVTGSQLKRQFFPKDLSYLSYVDVWLPEDATISSTNVVATQAEQVVRRVTEEYGREHLGDDGTPRSILKSITTFIGGGGPRFWFSVAPELVQPNYAQLIINVEDKHDTQHLVPLLQHALAADVPGARVDVRQLETGKPVGIPVSIRLSGERADTLRDLAEGVKAIFRSVPLADRVRDDWGADSFSVKLEVDSDRANFAGVSNLDVALSSATAMNGFQVTTLREGDKQIPVLARLRLEERARLTDVQNLYVFAFQSAARVPLRQVSTVSYGISTEKIRRRNQFRTVTVAAFPVPGALASEVLKPMMPALAQFEQKLPPGYRLEIGGEHEEQAKGFGELAVVLFISVLAIYLALVLQFRNAIKPLIVFSAIPFGAIGALVSLIIMGAPFGFMAFLGVVSLIGVIVSHVIVLFDFIEEMHEKGEPLRDALLDAGIARLRPVLITVGATVFGLVPLALHGGPLWEGLCYTQIGGLTLATVVTLVLVPVLYAIFVLDLKLVKWESVAEAPHAAAVARP
jgi:multidrug efflux pump subunit AcrB